MAERDVTGEVMQRSLHALTRLRERMRSTIPYGPTREFLSGKEARLQMQNMDPETKRRLMERVGPDQWQQMMKDLYNVS